TKYLDQSFLVRSEPLSRFLARRRSPSNGPFLGKSGNNARGRERGSLRASRTAAGALLRILDGEQPQHRIRAYTRRLGGPLSAPKRTGRGTTTVAGPICCKCSSASFRLLRSRSGLKTPPTKEVPRSPL